MKNDLLLFKLLPWCFEKEETHCLPLWSDKHKYWPILLAINVTGSAFMPSAQPALNDLCKLECAMPFLVRFAPSTSDGYCLIFTIIISADVDASFIVPTIFLVHL